MTLPDHDTAVLYPAGTTTALATVVHVEAAPSGLLAVVLDRTPCHPVDPVWPDQGADHGVIVHEGRESAIVDATVGASDGSNLFIGAEVPVKKGAEGWAFVVVHLLAPDAGLSEGDAVEVIVDDDYRAALSTGHTACHLASLALNRALAGAWSKDARRDALGSSDFDQIAIETSTIIENGSVDEFRIGRSVRRAGFNPAALDQLTAIEAAANATLADWVANGAGIRIARDGDGLTDRRYWIAALPEGEARIPCGGTHLTGLGDLSEVRIALRRRELDGAVGLTMTTAARPLP